MPLRIELSEYGNSNFQKLIGHNPDFLDAWNHLSITKDHFDILREAFNDNEISELCSIISFITCSQKIGRVFNLTEEYQPSKTTSMKELESKE
ncbi:hypothetical protein [Leptospira sp. 'Mane']|uniref:hypothetical protein n=1 Tax=Leptospira sp. 'Mane' TaxID=3387407 RepID=UPI00398A6887